MNKQCRQCSKTFTVDAWEQDFYTRMKVPHPIDCPDCRRQCRLAHRGKNFYMRQCDLCKKMSMSMYSPQLTGLTLYCNDCWQSDKWDPFAYGRDFDFSRPFFEQFYELYQAVPKHISNAIANENSEYVINGHRNKNCYLLDEGDFCEYCYYCYSAQHSQNMVDCSYVTKCEIGYQLIKCGNCYNCFYSFNSYNCADSYFLVNCRGVKNSILCSNLRNVEYHILNQPCSPEEFAAEKNKIFSGSYRTLQDYIKQYEELKKKSTYPHVIGTYNNDVTGNYLVRCENVSDAYYVNNSSNCRYISEMHNSKDTMDTDWYETELCYQSLHAGPQSSNLIGVHFIWFCNSVYYSDEIHYSQDIIASCGLKKQKYVVMNKQYTEAEYKQLRDKIIAHMSAIGGSTSGGKETVEWGQYFPVQYSPHGYNQTFAQIVAPLTKNEVLARGWNWVDDEPEHDISASLPIIPDNIAEVDDAICAQVLKCADPDCGKPFKIIPQELEFYQQHTLPLPRLCPTSRYNERFQQLGPRQLWDRECMCTQVDHSHTGQCAQRFATTYAPNRPEIVYCENCYIITVQ